jgi:hypothetical protein
MKLLLRVQMELFASPPPELISSERQKAIALLRVLLMEAAIQDGVPASGGERESGNE